MGKYVVELWLDGYNSDAEMDAACKEFIHEQLNMTASSVGISDFEQAQKQAELRGFQRVIDLLRSDEAKSDRTAAAWYASWLESKRDEILKTSHDEADSANDTVEK